MTATARMGLRCAGQEMRTAWCGQCVLTHVLLLCVRLMCCWCAGVQHAQDVSCVHPWC
jgi:hypothetical protein